MRIYEMNFNILKFKISKIAKYIEIFKYPYNILKWIKYIYFFKLLI